MQTRRVAMVVVALLSSVIVNSNGVTDAHGMSERHSSAAVATPAWNVDASPQPATGSRGLAAVACATATTCFAVGGDSSTPGSYGRPVVQQFDGSAWRQVADGLDPEMLAYLQGVTCPSPTICIAVGSTQNGTQHTMIVDTWVGGTWDYTGTLPVIGATDSFLTSVSCSSVSTCAAVGSWLDASGGRHALYVELAQGEWTPRPVPSAPNASTSLGSVSCPTTDFCVAGGVAFTSTAGVSVPHPWIVRWNGSTWTNDPVSAAFGQIFDVDCVSTSQCVALDFTVGSGIQSLVRSWNGTTWSTAPGPVLPSHDIELQDLTCTVAGCTAVGESWTQFGIGPSTPLVASLSGSTWTVSDHPDARPSGLLQGVACPAANNCVAVGTTNATGQGSATLTRALTAHQIVGPADSGVTVPWSAAEDVRLAQMANYLGITPEQMQHDAVGVVAFILGLVGDPTPSPVTLPNGGSDAARVSIWHAADLPVLATVRSKFAVDDSDAHRLAVGIVSFLLGLGGH